MTPYILIAEDALKRAWELLNGDVVLVWKSPDSRSISSCRPSSLTRMVDICKKMSDWNCFLVLNPTRGVSKPAISDILSVRWMMLDFDPLHGTPRHDEFPLRKLRDWLCAKGIDDPLTVPEVLSGRGVQWWMPVEQGALTVPDAHRAFKVLGKEVAALMEHDPHWKFDTTCADVSRIVRCPGTINTKSGVMASLAWPCGRCGGVKLSEITLPEEAPALTPLPSADWSFLAPRLHQFNTAFLLSGTSTGRESRHSRLFNCAKELSDLGIERGRAASLLENGANRCSPNLIKDDPMCVERVVRQLWPD